MEMFRKHTSQLLVIIAGLLSCIATADAQNARSSTGRIPATTIMDTTIAPTNSRIYTLCELSTPSVLSVTPTSDPFIIQSPNYPNDYANNLDCFLTIASGAEPIVLSFEYRVFGLEVVQNCVFDYLCVVGVKFCGSWATRSIFQRILPPLSNSTLHFHTDVSVTQSGIYIVVTPQPVFPINQVEGSGWSPDSITYVPATYYPGMPYTDGCSQGLNDTDDSVGNVTTEQTTITTQNTATSTEGTPAVYSTSASRQQDTYYFCNNEQSNYIDINSSSSPFIIRTPNYGDAPYTDNLYCSLVIRSGAEPLVLSLRITDFDLENSGTCYYDYLCVHGTKFCGAWLNGYTLKYILPGNSRFTTIFKTDSSATGRGFEIEISPELAHINQVVRQPSGDVASRDTSLSYTWEIYRPEYPYSDSCVTTTTSPVSTTGGVFDSTVAPTSNDNFCYSAAQVQRLNEFIDNAITDLNAARELLLQRK